MSATVSEDTASYLLPRQPVALISQSSLSERAECANLAMAIATTLESGDLSAVMSTTSATLRNTGDPTSPESVYTPMSPYQPAMSDDPACLTALLTNDGEGTRRQRCTPLPAPLFLCSSVRSRQMSSSSVADTVSYIQCTSPFSSQCSRDGNFTYLPLSSTSDVSFSDGGRRSAATSVTYLTSPNTETPTSPL